MSGRMAIAQTMAWFSPGMASRRESIKNNVNRQHNRSRHTEVHVERAVGHVGVVGELQGAEIANARVDVHVVVPFLTTP